MPRHAYVERELVRFGARPRRPGEAGAAWLHYALLSAGGGVSEGGGGVIGSSGLRGSMPEHRSPKPGVAFSGDRFFLSNFYPHPFLFNGRMYATAEHAFQAAKCVDQDEAERVRQAPSPAAAKQIGRRVRLRAGWDEARIDIMRAVLAATFSDPDLRARLVATGDAELVEENTWGDRFWGRSRGVGKNMLGQLLMELRDSLRGAA